MQISFPCPSFPYKGKVAGLSPVNVALFFPSMKGKKRKKERKRVRERRRGRRKNERKRKEMSPLSFPSLGFSFLDRKARDKKKKEQEKRRRKKKERRRRIEKNGRKSV